MQRVNRFALVAALAAAAAITWTGAAEASIRVTASTNDLASIAAEVGGERVEVNAIARAGGDPHRVEVLPSAMVRVSRAQLYLKVGLGLDAWADWPAALERQRWLRALSDAAGRV